ncbi:hypothetical protein [Sphingobacterium daejeonense]|uniref:hypothetical protein n=1 Tax=Sphingobacterium daejeonense TaxID=371142 RepID=UPI0010C310D6|nr:hypothetical protein [Sphingobacterium daejeonense]VTP97611.1 Uncharacterised protein [Sphingobacterium daejeonense]
MAKQSNARQQSLDWLDNLGTDRTEFKDPEKGLEGVCADFVDRVVQNITDQDLIATGSIANIELQIVNPNEINIIGEKYINFLDEGVQGSVNAIRAPFSPYKYTDKMPPVQEFIDWINLKNLKVRNTSYNLGSDAGKDEVFSGDEKAIEQMAYAMAKDRFLNGAEPKNIFKKEIPKLLNDATNQAINITYPIFFQT